MKRGRIDAAFTPTSPRGPVRDHYKPFTLVQHGLDMYRRPTYKPGTQVMFDGIDKVFVVGRHMELRRAE